MHPTQTETSRPRGWIFTATAVLSLSLWVIMAAAEVCTPLHMWLHGGTIPDNDGCAIAMVAHGKVEAAACTTPVVTPVIWIEIAPRIENKVIFESTVSSFHS